MCIKIGHASIDETGKVSGGKSGDQTKKEICIRSWYNKAWNIYLECTDPIIANKAANLMEQICTNDNYGYDQSERLSGYFSIIKNDGKVAAGKGEFDCSSLVATCYKLAGLNVSPSNTTRSLKQAFLSTGKFKVYSASSYLTTDKYAKRGGIYLSEGSHVVMALENGKINDIPLYAKPNRNVMLRDKGTSVGWIQTKLVNAGIDSVLINGRKIKLEIDSKFGVITEEAVRVYQRNKGLLVDGIVGVNTIKALDKE